MIRKNCYKNILIKGAGVFGLLLVVVPWMAVQKFIESAFILLAGLAINLGFGITLMNQSMPDACTMYRVTTVANIYACLFYILIALFFLWGSFEGFKIRRRQGKEGTAATKDPLPTYSEATNWTWPLGLFFRSVRTRDP